MVSTNYILNTTHNETEFAELGIISPLGFSIYHTNHIMELVNEWFQTGKFRKLHTPFQTDSTYEKDLMDSLPLAVNFLCKVEMEYHGNFGHTLGRIQQISLMSIIDICYTA